MAAQRLAAAKLKHFFASMSKKLTIGEGMKQNKKDSRKVRVHKIYVIELGGEYYE